MNEEVLVGICILLLLIFFLIKIAFLTAKLRNLKEKGKFNKYDDFMKHIISTVGVSNYFFPIPFSEKEENNELEITRKSRNRSVILFWVIFGLMFFIPLLFKFTKI